MLTKFLFSFVSLSINNLSVLYISLPLPLGYHKKSISLYLESAMEAPSCISFCRVVAQLNSNRTSQLQQSPPLACISRFNAENMLPTLVFPDSLLVKLQLGQVACNGAQANRNASDSELGL